jgi:antagonist of KipI
MACIVEEAALMMSIQDAGRQGFRRFGLPASGPMDWWAFRGAHRLVGNPTRYACVEIGFSSSLISFMAEGLLAVCGAGYRLFLNNREIPLWMAFFVRGGDQLMLEKIPGGNWVYLAAAGGFQSQMWLGSRSVYPRAGLGGLISGGDRLVLSEEAFPRRLAGRFMPMAARPTYSQEVEIRVIPGPHTNRFTQEGLHTFWHGAYQVSSRSDRMGYRLKGPVLKHQHRADLISQGMVLGEIQVPEDGQPIVMMPDHPTTGGYTCIGTVAKVDLPLIAQAEPLVTNCYFVPTVVEDAQAALVDTIRLLDTPIEPKEEEWLLL